MFTNISWTDYIVVVTILLVLYYLFIWLRFYIHELKNIFLNGSIRLGAVPKQAPSRKRTHHESEQKVIDQSPGDFAEDAKEAYLEVEDLVGGLKVAIKEGVQKQLSKVDLSQNLRSILKAHSSLKTSTFRAAIIELIISECEKYGSTILNEDEVAVLWDSD